MTIKTLKKIFEETDAKWEGDNAMKGLMILSKYLPIENKTLICAAGHDIIYGPNVDEVVDKLTEEDAIALAKLNWMISEFETFSCFV